MASTVTSSTDAKNLTEIRLPENGANNVQYTVTGEENLSFVGFNIEDAVLSFTSNGALQISVDGQEIFLNNFVAAATTGENSPSILLSDGSQILFSQLYNSTAQTTLTADAGNAVTGTTVTTDGNIEPAAGEEDGAGLPLDYDLGGLRTPAYGAFSIGPVGPLGTRTLPTSEELRLATPEAPDTTAPEITVPDTINLFDIFSVDNSSVAASYGNSFSSLITATDDSGVASLEVTLANGDPLPSFMTFNAATGVPSLNRALDHNDAGSYDILVKATDANGNVASKTFTLNVNSVDTVATATFDRGTAAGDDNTGAGSNIYYGLEGDDTIEGTAADDYISGGQGADTVSSGAGNDFVAGGEGADNISSGDGDDRIFGDRTSYVDPVAVAGVNYNDTIMSGAGNDTVYGDLGDDTIYAGADEDTVYGGVGNDYIDGGDGNDSLSGEDGNDHILGGAGNDELLGGAGNDQIAGGTGDDTIYGGDGNDLLRGDLDFKDGQPEATGNDTIYGGAGDDKIGAKGGNDYVSGGEGRDTIWGDAGDDIIDGDEGNDTLYGDAGNDTVNGGLGNDRIRGNDGNDILNGNEGDDSLLGDAGDDTIHGNDGNDTLSDGSGVDALFGDAGNDLFKSSTQDSSNDTFDGGDGFDTINMSSAKKDITVDFETGRITGTGGEISNGTGAGADLITSVEGAVSGSGNDSFISSSADEFMDGGAHTTYDIAYFSGKRSEYNITPDPTTVAPGAAIVVEDTVAGRDGTDSLIRIEYLKFSDGYVKLGDNTAPEAEAVSSNTDEDTSVSGTLLGSDADLSDTSLTYRVVSDSVKVNGVDAPTLDAAVSVVGDQFTFDPAGLMDYLAEGETADVTFEYQAFDGKEYSTPATVTITVDGVNDAPYFTAPIDQTISEDSTLNAVTLPYALATDPEGEALTYSLSSGSVKVGADSVPDNFLTMSSDGKITFDPTVEFNHLNNSETETVTFSYTATDIHGASAVNTATLTINGQDEVVVTPPNQAPVKNHNFFDQLYNGFEDFTFKLDINPSFSDPDFDPINFRVKAVIGGVEKNVSALGLSFDASTGVLSGVPINTGQALVRIYADDGKIGYSDDITIFFNKENGTLTPDNPTLLEVFGTNSSEGLQLTDNDPHSPTPISTGDSIYLSALAGNDNVIGSFGNDFLRGGSGNNSYQAGAGDDTIMVEGTSSYSSYQGDIGEDTILGHSGTTVIGIKSGANQFTGIEHIDGGSTGTNYIQLQSGYGNILDMSGVKTVENIDYIIDSNRNDIITGTQADDYIKNAGGIDTVHGHLGNDTLEGAGFDSLYGDEGNDTFVLDSTVNKIDGGTGFDRILATDTIQLDTFHSLDVGTTFNQTSHVELLDTRGSTVDNLVLNVNDVLNMESDYSISGIEAFSIVKDSVDTLTISDYSSSVHSTGTIDTNGDGVADTTVSYHLSNNGLSLLGLESSAANITFL